MISGVLFPHLNISLNSCETNLTGRLTLYALRLFPLTFELSPLSLQLLIPFPRYCKKQHQQRQFDQAEPNLHCVRHYRLVVL